MDNLLCHWINTTIRLLENFKYGVIIYPFLGNQTSYWCFLDQSRDSPDVYTASGLDRSSDWRAWSPEIPSQSDWNHFPNVICNLYW